MSKLLKQKVKFQIKGDDGKLHRMTATIMGRNTLELNGRVEKYINIKMHQGWELR